MGETFIKMCKEATEIQEGWEPKNGDQFVFEDEIYFVGNYMGDGIVLYKEDEMKNTDGKIIKEYSNAFREFMGGYEWDDEFVCNKYDAVWLPRQEDLQRIYKEFFNLHDEMVILYHFKLWENSLMAIVQKLFPSINVTWLCFVMGTCYNKRWNGSTWEVVKDE